MRGVVYESYGEPDQVVRVRDDLDIPLVADLRHNQVLVKVYYASINPADWKVIKGLRQMLACKHPSEASPCRAGFDFSGVIVNVARNASHNFREGDQVLGIAADFDSLGTFAEYFVAHTDCIALKPSHMSHQLAASLPVVACTSVQALFEQGQLEYGDKVLILGGTCATGIIAIQLANRVGAMVTTTCRGQNEQFVRNLGADEVIDYTKANFADVVEPHSFDLVYACVTSNPKDVARVLKPDTGRCVNIVVGGSYETGDKIDFKYIPMRAWPNGKQLGRVIEEKNLKMEIQQVFALDQVGEALAKSMEGHVRGKLLLKLGD